MACQEKRPLHKTSDCRKQRHAIARGPVPGTDIPMCLHFVRVQRKWCLFDSFTRNATSGLVVKENVANTFQSGAFYKCQTSFFELRNNLSRCTTSQHNIADSLIARVFPEASQAKLQSAVKVISMEPSTVVTFHVTTGEAPCGAHVFEGFFGLENGPVKSDKSQEKTLFGKDFPKPAKTQS